MRTTPVVRDARVPIAIDLAAPRGLTGVLVAINAPHDGAERS